MSIGQAKFETLSSQLLQFLKQVTCVVLKITFWTKTTDSQSFLRMWRNCATSPEVRKCREANYIRLLPRTKLVSKTRDDGLVATPFKTCCTFRCRYLARVYSSISETYVPTSAATYAVVSCDRLIASNYLRRSTRTTYTAFRESGNHFHRISDLSQLLMEKHHQQLSFSCDNRSILLTEVRLQREGWWVSVDFFWLVSFVFPYITRQAMKEEAESIAVL